MAKPLRYTRCMGTCGNTSVRPSRVKMGRYKKTTIVGSKFSHKLLLQANYEKLGVKANMGIAAKDLEQADSDVQ